MDSPTRVGGLFLAGSPATARVRGFWADSPTRVGFFFSLHSAAESGGLLVFAPVLSLSSCSHDIKKKRPLSFMFCLILITSECDSMVSLSIG